MKRKIVPTSPQSPEFQERLKIKNQRTTVDMHPHLLFAVIVATLCFGALAGFFGFVIAASVPSSFPVLGKIAVSDSPTADSSDENVFSVWKRGSSVIQNAPEILDTVLLVYGGTPSIDSSTPFIGNAMLLTADGWMVMPTALFSKEHVVITADQHAVPIDQSIEDPIGGLTFFHIPIENASVVEFPNRDQLVVGQSVWVIEETSGSSVSYEATIAGLSDGDVLARSTQTFSERYRIDTGSSSVRSGSPVFSTQGVFMGIVGEDHTVLPASFIQSVLRTLIDTGAARRSEWDIQYVNLQHLPVEVRRTYGTQESGIAVIDIQVRPSKVPTNLLQSGDIIHTVNNTFMNAQSDLSQIIHSHPTGSILYMTIIREGKELFIEFPT